MKFLLATARAHSTPSGSSISSRDSRLAASPIFIMSVAGLLEEVVGEFGALAPFDDLTHPFEPAPDVKEHFGGLAVHYSGTVSRRTAPANRPPMLPVASTRCRFAW